MESLWRYKWPIAAAGLVFAVLGLAVSQLQSDRYVAEATVILTDPRANSSVGLSSDLREPDRFVRNQAALMSSSEVAARASELLDGRYAVTAIRENTQAIPSFALDQVTVRAEAPTATDAADTANALVTAYQQVVAEGVQGDVEAAIANLLDSKVELERRISELDSSGGTSGPAVRAERNALLDQLEKVNGLIEEATVNTVLFGTAVQAFERAVPPGSPVSPQPIRDGIAAAALGLIIAGSLAWWRGQGIILAQDQHAPASVLGAPALGQVPAFAVDRSLPVAVAAPGSVASEAYQFSLSALDRALGGAGGVVAVTSASPGDGKTVTALNLALAATADGRRPLLVDADERMRAASALMPSNDGDQLGLTDLAQDADLEVKDTVTEVELPGGELAILGSGTRPEVTAAFFRSEQFPKVMAKLRSYAALIFIDTPPVLVVGETVDIAAEADAVLLVVKQGAELRDIEDARERLALSGTPVVGYVFNQVRHAAFSYYGHDRSRRRYLGKRS